MKKSTQKLLITFVLMLLMNACFSQTNPAIKTRYYTLEYPSVNFKQMNGHPQISNSIRVERFSVAPIYNSNRIIYRETDFERNEYNYHKWRANPGDLVTYFLTRDLKNASLFRAVFFMDSRFPATHMIEGIVDEFYEKDEGDVWKAVVTVSITLMREKEPDISQRVLFQKRYHVEHPCRQKNPKALADAMSEGMAQISELIIMDVYQSLSTN